MIIISKSKNSACLALLSVVLLGSSMLSAADDYEYAVDVDSSLAQLRVVARFATAISNVSARSRTAAQFLIDAEDCDSGKRIEIRNRRMLLPQQGVQCLRYSIDLRKAAQAERRNESLDTRNIVVSPTVWMWRPRLRDDDGIIVRFNLPVGLGVSVPWAPVNASDDSYRLASSPQSGTAMSIFGRFDSAVADVAGTDLRIDLLHAAADYDAAAIVEWIRDTAGHITLAYGRFPNPAARIIVFPVTGSTWRSDSRAVVFGRVVRDGGETVELLVDPSQPIEAFYADWTATHELSHMMLPYLRGEQRWVSEGFAQYYQNLLLARAGRYTEQYAWQKLHDGLQRGRESVPDLSPNAAASGDERNSRMKVYWSGAALALMADVELRRRSRGRESLDTVLGRFQRCCLPSRRTWSGTELFTKFDSLLDEPLFMQLYLRYADASGFPDVRPLLEQLGVVVEGGDVRFSNDAELAETRAALTAQRYTDVPGN
jgi:hypothetical protein